MLVDRGDLVRERLEDGGMDGENRIEQVGQADSVCLGDEPEEVALAIETPRPADLNDFEGRLAVAIEELVGDLARGVLVGQFDAGVTEPLGGYDRNRGIRQDAAYGRTGGEVLKPCHVAPKCGWPGGPLRGKSG